MTHPTLINTVIFSAHRAEMSFAENMHRTIEMAQILTDMRVPFERAFGCYEGDLERSFVAPLGHLDPSLFDLVLHRYSQECVGVNRVCGFSLVDDTDTWTRIGGALRPVSPKQAWSSIGWTYYNNTFYITD